MVNVGGAFEMSNIEQLAQTWTCYGCARLWQLTVPSRGIPKMEIPGKKKEA